MATRRPAGVTLVAALAWLSGLLQIITGILLLAGVGARPGSDPIAPWASLVIGAITIIVSLGLFRGSNGARILTAIIFVANIASAVYVMFVHGLNATALIGGFLALIGLILLFTRGANEFFRGGY
ncbi:hypothetical protein GCM10009775_00760 [Microbacterium aoyamense]|uniref:Integral membrane protein n=1 Tax=Microbacterium aoyamense TaxID=344166 RepID=A0ABN2P4V7_9MICO|nr:hypothetical protein [Microbacterium aoyamense]